MVKKTSYGRIIEPQTVTPGRLGAMASFDRLRVRDAADAEHSLVILERTLKTLGFDAVFSIKQLESNINGDSTPQAPTEWIMHARVRQTPGLLPGECGYDATC
jgi:hypothetical protein